MTVSHSETCSYSHLVTFGLRHGLVAVVNGSELMPQLFLVMIGPFPDRQKFSEFQGPRQDFVSMATQAKVHLV